MNPTTIAIVGFFIVAVAAGLILLLAFFMPRKAFWRRIPVITGLKRQVGLSVEDGRQLHFSIGRANLLTPDSMASLTALNAFDQVVRSTAHADRPPVVTSGDGALSILSQSTIFSASGSPTAFLQGQLAGLTPFSYTVGALQEVQNEEAAANVLIGHFGLELALLTEAAERAGSFVMAGSDDLAAQAVAYAASDQPLIGEELYVVGAYLSGSPVHQASVKVQDIYRWVIVFILIVGAILNLAGIL